MSLSAAANSYYSASAGDEPARAALAGSLEADVCIIGAGLTGLSAALELGQRGYDVVVLEANRVGFGASGRNGGHVGTGQRKDQDELESLLGREAAGRFWQYSLDAVARIQRLIDEHAIDCDLKRGALMLAIKPRHDDEYRAYAAKLRDDYGYRSIRYVERDEARSMVGSTRYLGGMLDSGALHLHPLKFVHGLASAAERTGVRLFEHSRVNSVSHATAAEVRTTAGRVRAKTVIYACNGYLAHLCPKLASAIMPINNFVIATEPLDDALARELIRDDVSVSDSLFVINYWKLSGDRRLLFGGGETYSTAFPRDIAGFVRRYMLEVYPQLESTRIDYAWGGTLAITLKRMPDIGRLADNVYYAQGYSGHGLPTATFAGELIADAIDGKAGRFEEFARLPVRRFPGGTLLRWPALVLGMSWYALRDRL